MNSQGLRLKCAVVMWMMVAVTPAAFSSGTGIPLVGGPIPGISRGSTRQIVRLESAGGLLVGRPRSGALAMIAAHAPGCAAGDIVIRERQAEGNSTVLQIVTPPCLRENLVQATLFLRHGTSRVRFARKSGFGWFECRIQTIPVPAANQADRFAFPLPAVVVDDLALIQLLGEHPREAGPAELRLPWTARLPARIGRAAWHLLWPVVTLVIFFFLSWSVHKAATLRGRG